MAKVVKPWMATVRPLYCEDAIVCDGFEHETWIVSTEGTVTTGIHKKDFPEWEDEEVIIEWYWVG